MKLRSGALVTGSLYIVVASGCIGTIFPSAEAARADWLCKNPTPANVSEAIRLDPLNGYAYTLEGDFLEQSGQFSDAEQAWRKVLERNPRDAEAGMRTALLLEQRGAVDESERCLRHGAEVNRTWLPRWSLVNFYARHGRKQELYRYSRLALARASDDVGALFPILKDSGATPDVMLGLLPRNRSVMSAWLAFELQQPLEAVQLEPGAMRLVSLIPKTAPGWPGTDVTLWPNHRYPVEEGERWLLLSVVDHLLDAGKGAEAVHFWDVLIDHQIVASDRSTPASPLTNTHFRFDAADGGLNWRLNPADHIEAQLATDPGEVVFRVDGHQPESVELLRQRVYLPAGSDYQLVVESRTEGLVDDNGLGWQIVDRAGQIKTTLAVHPSEDWRRETVPLSVPTQEGVVSVVLTCRRLPGSVRAEGTVRFRLVSLEQSH